MANLKEVRIRIASVSSTKQITSAMKMVSASKLRKAQNAILKMRPYSNKLVEIVQNISADTSVETPFTTIHEVNHVLVIVITSNKGLCGAFNANIIKESVKGIEEYIKKGVKVSIICIGKRASEFFQRTNYNVVAEYNHLFDNLNFEKAAEVANSLLKDFENRKYDQIEFTYNRFKNAATQIITNEQWLPVLLKEEEVHIESIKEQKKEIEYIFDPNKEEILENLIPLTLRSQFFKVLLDSFASEHGARMVAMQTATDNATSLLKDLKLSYNKARQTGITNELIEIISGANALNG